MQTTTSFAQQQVNRVADVSDALDERCSDNTDREMVWARAQHYAMAGEVSFLAAFELALQDLGFT